MAEPLQVTTQEAELIEWLRGERSDRFNISIGRADGRWIVRLADVGFDAPQSGEGADFGEAWAKRVPWGPADRDPSLASLDIIEGGRDGERR